MDPRSEKNLTGVHPDLVRVMRKARTKIAFIVIEGLRSKERQEQLVRSGASRTMNSRHLTGHAVDVMALVNGEGRWDWPLYVKIAYVVKEVAQEEGVAIVWGGDWRRFRDGPHYELDRKVYP
jgi:peptidoglycan L-alanyl-D-glutamate endopeptidase CwlK